MIVKGKLKLVRVGNNQHIYCTSCETFDKVQLNNDVINCKCGDNKNDKVGVNKEVEHGKWN